MICDSLHEKRNPLKNRHRAGRNRLPPIEIDKTYKPDARLLQLYRAAVHIISLPECFSPKRSDISDELLRRRMPLRLCGCMRPFPAILKRLQAKRPLLHGGPETAFDHRAGIRCTVLLRSSSSGPGQPVVWTNCRSLSIQAILQRCTRRSSSFRERGLHSTDREPSEIFHLCVLREGIRNIEWTKKSTSNLSQQNAMQNPRDPEMPTEGKLPSSFTLLIFLSGAVHLVDGLHNIAPFVRWCA